MTPVLDFRSISRNSSYTRILNTLIPRSQSDSSQTSLATVADKRPRRGSDYSETVSILPRDDMEKDETHVILRPLQLSNAEDAKQGSLLQRRLSRGIVTSKSSSNFSADSSSKGITRSYSVKSSRKATEHRRRHRGSSIPTEVGSTCSGTKVQERTISNRSLPLPGDESEYTRLRNFSTKSKRIINRGDSFRSKSSSNVPLVLASRAEKQEALNVAFSHSPSDTATETGKAAIYEVLIIGAPDVGKSSIKKQFMTSEYICAYDSSHEDEPNRGVTIVLNSEESQLEFEEETLFDDSIPLVVSGVGRPDALVVVYSVASRRSYLRARHLLYQLAPRFQDEKTAVILVGNKTDLARLRAVTTDEGRSLAKERGCKFIETSVAINHQVDELLVGVLTQIRMKTKLAEKNMRRNSQSRKSSIYRGSKASGVLKKILQRACLKSQSCDNLHVL